MAGSLLDFAILSKNTILPLVAVGGCTGTYKIDNLGTHLNNFARMPRKGMIQIIIALACLVGCHPQDDIHPPYIGTAPIFSDLNEGNLIEAEVGEPIEFQLSATDIDGDALAFSWDRANLPPAANYVDNDDGSCLFSWETSINDAGIYTPIFTISDGELTANLTITITIVLPHFSFFVTSLASMQKLSGSLDGFGGDLRYGETGAGAGLRGADKICMEIAELSMTGAAVKEWRAFLSVHDDGNGYPMNAIDRIGDGPWYDRLGRLVAPNKLDLLHPRPQNGDPTIKNDLPNEWGVPNRQPDPNEPPQLNHHTLTGSRTDGTLYPSSCKDGEDSIFLNSYNDCIEAGLSREECLEFNAVYCIEPVSSTCSDWTTADGDNGEMIDHNEAQDPWATFGSSGRPRFGLSWRREGGIQEWLSIFSAVGCAPGGVITPSGRNRNIPSVGYIDGYGGIYCFGLKP